MNQSSDARNMLSAIYFQANGELLRLMEGFYSNIEDGLFELAYNNSDATRQRQVIELMRELRYRREHLLNTFSRRVQRAAKRWIENNDFDPDYLEERKLADGMVATTNGHFGPLLQTVAERISHAISHHVEGRKLPISPEEVSYHFVMSCRSVQFDHYSIATVKSLFQRFVLDRLGGIYGTLNQQLADAGYRTELELQTDIALSSRA